MRRPARRVMAADRWAGRIITASGIGGILAVSLVGLFLLWVALPLLLPTRLEPGTGAPLPRMNGGGHQVLARALDRHATMAWSLLADGTVEVRELASGGILAHQALAGRPTCNSQPDPDGGLALGFGSGTVVMAKLAFAPDFFNEQEVPPELRNLVPGQSRPWRQGIVTRTPEGQLRWSRLTIAAEEPVAVADTALVLIDAVPAGQGYVLAALDAAGRLHYRKLTVRTNMLTGRRQLRSRGFRVRLADLAPEFGDDLIGLKVDDTGRRVILISGKGRSVLVEEKDGRLLRLGEANLVSGTGTGVTALTYLAGHVSLVVGDSRGGLTVWFPVSGTGGRPPALVRVHTLQDGPAAVTALAASGRSRLLAAGFADGTVKVYNVTADRVLGTVDTKLGAIGSVTVAPREDLVLATGSEGVLPLRLTAPHGAVSLRTLLAPVWYEGYAKPAYVWQSSASSEGFEPKMSLAPLIFGTMKATFYSLLFGLPLAMLAAVYTSEFMPRRTRARIKPVMEVMASLPSVVLGFLAALVIAPVVEQVAMEVVCALLLIPFSVLLGAHLWQFLPPGRAVQWEKLRPWAVLAAMVLGVLVAWRLGPWAERILCGGDFKRWLDGRIGSGVPGWTVLLLAPAGLLSGWVNVTTGERLLRGLGSHRSHSLVALADLARFLIAAAGTVGLAWFMGWSLAAAGWDPRGSLLGTYVQRNALVVGIAMGFAIIPIIYSISEDALVSVPDHLRAASYGAGATPWQTAVRVVIPPAMSGLFSAAMIGIGRAVGETMIVLMAAGNTPIMDLNIFNGFRTLSANLAVELPEAVQGSTHYRVLFLAALALFVMTFVLNTAAEGVRLHFRRRTRRL